MLNNIQLIACDADAEMSIEYYIISEVVHESYNRSTINSKSIVGIRIQYTPFTSSIYHKS